MNSEEFSLVGMNKTGLATKSGVASDGGTPSIRKKPIQGFGLNYLVEFLQFLQLEMPANQIYRASPYDFKSATLKMMKWCLDRELISKREDYGKVKSKFKSKQNKRPNVFYCITQDGRTLLRLIS